MGKYEIDKEKNRPKNPQGRTGCLYKNFNCLVLSHLVKEFFVFQ